MSTLRTLHQSSWLCVREFECHARASGFGPEEASPHDSVALPLAGVFVRRARGQDVVANANHVLFFRRDEPYRVAHPTDGGDRTLVLIPSTESVASLNDGARWPPSRVASTTGFAATHGPSPSHLCARAHRLRHAVMRDHADPLEVDELAVGVLAAALDAATPWMSSAVSCSDRVTPTASRRVRATCELLATRFRERLTLHAVARDVGASPFHLARAFRRVTGVPLHRYVIHLRTRDAAWRLAQGAGDLTTLAHELGFADHSHLTRAFRREFGVPPSHWRVVPRMAGGRKIVQATRRADG